MADIYKIYAYTSTPDSDHTDACSVKYDEDWKNASQPIIGSVNCTGFSLELHHTKDKFVLEDSTGASLTEFDPRRPTHIALYRDDKSVLKAKTFSSPKKVKEFYESLPERRQDDGPYFEVGIGPYFGTGTERSVLARDLNGLPSHHIEDAFTSTGFSLFLEPRWPRSGAGFWCSLLRTKLSFEYLNGTITSDYTSRDDQKGDFERSKIALWAGAQLDYLWLKRLFTSQWNAPEGNPLLDVSISYLAPVIGGQWMSGDWASLDEPLAVSNSFSTWLYPSKGQQHRIEAEVQFRIVNHHRLGLLGFFLPYEQMEDGKYSDEYFPWGIMLTYAYGAYSRPKEITVAKGPLPKVTPKPAPPPTPKPVEELPPPPPEPEPEPAPEKPVILPKKDEFKVTGGGTFPIGSAALSDIGRAQVAEKAEEIGRYSRNLVEAGFYSKSPIYVSLEGYTSSEGSDDANQKLSEQRATAFRKELEKVIAAKRKKAKQTKTKNPFPLQIHYREKGYGETELVTVGGREDKENSRRVKLRVTSNREDFEKILPPTQLTPEAAANDQTQADKIKAKLEGKGPITQVFYRPGALDTTSTLNLVVKVTYANETDTLGKKAPGTFKTVFNAVTAQAKIFKLMSRNVTVQILLQSTPVSGSEEVESDRQEKAKNILFKFGKWPAPGGSEVLEVPVDNTPEQFVDSLAGRGASGKLHPELYQGIVATKDTVMIDGRSVDIYHLTTEFRDGQPTAHLRKTIRAFAQDVIRNQPYDVRFYHLTSLTDAEDRLRKIGNTFTDAVNHPPHLLNSVSDDRMPTMLFVAVAPQEILNQDALRKAILKIGLQK